MKNVEVELKFQVLDAMQMEKFLSNLRFIDEKRVVDVYLDTKEGSLFKKGLFVRIRDDKKLDFKFNLTDFQDQNKLSRHESCSEFSFTLPLLEDSVVPINEICQILNFEKIVKPDLSEFKNKNELIDSMTIDKARRRYNDGKFEYCFDDVKELGKFIEIELMASPEDNLEEIKNEMRERLSGLQLKLITTGYNEVYWRKYDFNLYLKGRYLFEEDYEKYRVNFRKI
jgi:adenylate cyclase class IV